jgi:hypothetical protein
MANGSATARNTAIIPEWIFNVLAASSVAVIVEFLIAILKPLLPLWSSPLREIWMNVFKLHEWISALRSVGAAFEFFAFLAALIVGATWLHAKGAGFEERLSSREAKISFVLTIIIFGTFIEPRLAIEQERPAAHSQSKQYR